MLKLEFKAEQHALKNVCGKATLGLSDYPKEQQTGDAEKKP